MLTDFLIDIKTPVTILHVLSVVFGMGAALMSDLLFNFYSKNKKLSVDEIKTLHLLSNTVWFSLVLIILSGVGIFFTNTSKYLDSVKFLSKMSIMLVLLINGFILHKYIWKQVVKEGFLVDVKKANTRKKAFIGGAISVISWVFVCALGVMDHIPYRYITIMTVYTAVILTGAFVSILIEKKDFEKTN